MNSYKVVADYIDERQFSFICPFCSTTEAIINKQQKEITKLKLGK